MKYALISRALSSTLEHLLGMRPTANPSSSGLSNLTARNPSLLSVLSSLSTNNNNNNLEVEADSSAIHSEDSSSSVSPLNPFVPPNTILSTSEPELSTKQSIVHQLISPMLLGLLILLAILVPDFGRVLSFLGSSSAFLICCIGPLIALLILGKKGDPDSTEEGGGGEDEEGRGGRGRRSIRKKYTTNGDERGTLLNNNSNNKGRVEGVWIVGSFERGISWILLIISVVFCLIGTVWTVAYPTTV